MMPTTISDADRMGWVHHNLGKPDVDVLQVMPGAADDWELRGIRAGGGVRWADVRERSVSRASSPQLESAVSASRSSPRWSN